MQLKATLRQRVRCSSARWRSARRCSGPNIRRPARASSTLVFCCGPKATLPGHGRCRSETWRSARRRWAPSIPIRRQVSPTLGGCCRAWPSPREPALCMSARWRSTTRSWEPSTPTRIRVRADLGKPSCRYWKPDRSARAWRGRARGSRQGIWVEASPDQRVPLASQLTCSMHSTGARPRRRCARSTASRSRRRDTSYLPLIPAQAGIQFFLTSWLWVPAFAGTSGA